jgi:hypothetical protein
MVHNDRTDSLSGVTNMDEEAKDLEQWLRAIDRPRKASTNGRKKKTRPKKKRKSRK